MIGGVGFVGTKGCSALVDEMDLLVYKTQVGGWVGGL